MDIANQIEKLKNLYDSGALSEQEFAAAKKKLLEPDPSPNLSMFTNQYPIQHRSTDDALGKAANRYVSMQMVATIIGAILFLIFLFSVFLPNLSRMHSGYRF